LPNTDHALRPGTFAEVALGLREIPQALVVPPQAVISTPKGKSVFIIEEGKAKSVAVQTGISDGRWIEITSGLQGHEEVVAVGKRRLLDGMPVQASPFNLPDAKPSQQKFERRVPGGTPPPPTAAPNGGLTQTGRTPMSRLLPQTTLLTLTTLALTALLASASRAADAEQPLTLPHGSFLGVQRAVDIAVKNHPMLLEGAANLKASEARTEQARSLYYPQVYANANTVAGGRSEQPAFPGRRWIAS
jgi:hypothetical protein